MRRTLQDFSRMIRLCAVLGMICLCGRSAPAQPAAPLIVEIRIEGNHRLSAEQILENLPFAAGERLIEKEPGALLKSANEKLSALGCAVPALDVDDSPADGVRLIVHIEEFPQLALLEITGNVKLKTDEIEAAVPFKVGDYLPVDAVYQVQRDIRKLYADEGYRSTVIKVERVPDSEAGWERLKIVITEGARLKVKCLELIGNDTLYGFTVKSVMQTRGSVWVIVQNYFDEREFEDDLQTISALYRSKGFLDVKVEAAGFEYGPDNKWVIPKVRIIEGPRFTIERIGFEGNRIFGAGEIQPLFSGFENEVYDGKKLNLALSALKRMYGDNGYIDVRVEADEQIDFDANRVDLQLRIEEKSRIRVRNLAVLRKSKEIDIGWRWLDKLIDKISPPVKDEVILREVQLQPGEIYRTFEELESERRLRRMQIFNAVDVRPVVTEEESERDVEVFVDELGLGSFVKFGVAFNDETGASIFLNYTENNFLGEANHLTFDLLLGQNSTRASIAYVDRYQDVKSKLMRKLLRAEEAQRRYDLFYYELDRDEYEEKHLGAALTWSMERDEFHSDSIRLKVDSVNLDADRDGLSSDFDEDYIVASIRFGWNFDNIDDDFFPTEGIERDFYIETGAADGFLLKFSGNFNYYRALAPKWVWAARTTYGFLPYDADTIGLSERFFLGGDSDMRGFDFRGAGPKDEADDDAELGGATKVLVQNELRYRITENIYTLGFVDLGTLGADVLDFADPRLSSGLGIRIRALQQRLYVSFDFAWSIIDEDEDETRVVHFRLGSRL